jgi:hypothetical protein
LTNIEIYCNSENSKWDEEFQNYSSYRCRYPIFLLAKPAAALKLISSVFCTCLKKSRQVNRNAVITGTYEAVPKHGHRILLDVQMRSPVVVVPVTPSSAHVLVGYPGNIAVSNSFR